MSAAFPLILTFSLREKEQRLDTCRFAKAFAFIQSRIHGRTLRAFPPLPKGEGRGEGKVVIHILNTDKMK
jgi:hypothetical protein